MVLPPSTRRSSTWNPAIPLSTGSKSIFPCLGPHLLFCFLMYHEERKNLGTARLSLDSGFVTFIEDGSFLVNLLLFMSCRCLVMFDARLKFGSWMQHFQKDRLFYFLFANSLFGHPFQERICFGSIGALWLWDGASKLWFESAFPWSLHLTSKLSSNCYKMLDQWPLEDVVCSWIR